MRLERLEIIRIEIALAHSPGGDIDPVVVASPGGYGNNLGGVPCVMRAARWQSKSDSSTLIHAIRYFVL